MHIDKVKCHPAYWCAPMDLPAEEMLQGPDNFFVLPINIKPSSEAKSVLIFFIALIVF